jgi:hypothetical protein
MDRIPAFARMTRLGEEPVISKENTSESLLPVEGVSAILVGQSNWWMKEERYVVSESWVLRPRPAVSQLEKRN